MRSEALNDPLGYPGYPEQFRQAREASGASESVSWTATEISGQRCVEVRFDFVEAAVTAGAQLASHKRPREVRLLDEPPRNALGKVVKAQLRERI